MSIVSASVINIIIVKLGFVQAQVFFLLQETQNLKYDEDSSAGLAWAVLGHQRSLNGTGPMRLLK